MRKILILLIPLSFFTLFFVVPRKITLTSVRCETQIGTCSTHLDEIVKSVVNKDLKSGWSEITQKLSGSSRVEKFALRFYLPGELVVYAVEKVPSVAVMVSGQAGYVLVNTEGDKIDTSESTSLPKVVIVGQNVLDSEVFFSAEVIKNLHSLHGSQEGKLSKGQFIVNLLPEVEFMYPTEGDIDVLLGSTELLLFQLNSLLEKSKIEDDAHLTGTIVDLRYENPVIRYKGNE